MRTFRALLKRNVKLFFKDKGLFFTSLITPLILLVLYATFLANVYRDSIDTVFKSFSVELPEKILNGVVGGQLFSSLLAVSCVTVAFCSNMLMVQDKVSGARKDLLLTPVKRSTMALSYYLSSLFTMVYSILMSPFHALNCHSKCKQLQFMENFHITHPPFLYLWMSSIFLLQQITSIAITGVIYWFFIVFTIC